MGKVCNYAVVDSDVPFTIDNNGVLSLPSPLSADYPSYVDFHVKATDCDNMDSDHHAVVRVTIKDPPITTATAQLKVPGCKPG